MLSKEALLLQHRSAFCAYLSLGIDEVKKCYPESQVFVEANKDKTLKEVTAILTQELDKLPK